MKDPKIEILAKKQHCDRFWEKAYKMFLETGEMQYLTSAMQLSNDADKSLLRYEENERKTKLFFIELEEEDFDLFSKMEHKRCLLIQIIEELNGNTKL